MNDPYYELGLGYTATPQEIKKAYRLLAKQFHFYCWDETNCPCLNLNLRFMSRNNCIFAPDDTYLYLGDLILA